MQMYGNFEGFPITTALFGLVIGNIMTPVQRAARNACGAPLSCCSSSLRQNCRIFPWGKQATQERSP